MADLYTYDLKTREYTGSRPAQPRPDGTPIVECLAATPVPPPGGCASRSCGPLERFCLGAGGRP